MLDKDGLRIFVCFFVVVLKAFPEGGLILSPSLHKAEILSTDRKQTHFHHVFGVKFYKN